MLTWSKARLVILALLLAVFTSIAYSRGLGWRLGGAPAALRGPCATEEAWAVGEIARDVAEMASFPANLPAGPAVQRVAGQAARYRVSRADGSGIEFRSHPIKGWAEE